MNWSSEISLMECFGHFAKNQPKMHGVYVNARNWALSTSKMHFLNNCNWYNALEMIILKAHFSPLSFLIHAT